MVRLRFGPSPTGMPTLGSVYQVLFNYAFAKSHSGDFILRIEDTDQVRTVAGAEDAIYAALDWFGLQEDESPRHPGKYGPYRQSERLDIYKKYAEDLIEAGHAYYCFCSKDRLDNLRQQQVAAKQPPRYDRHCRKLSLQEARERISQGEKPVIRMQIPDEKVISVQDGIRGEVKFRSEDLDDQVILKSDGFPTYHLAVVVDDHLMEISHVVRGEEWLPSSPKHYLLYDFFGWEKPQFYHTSALRNPDKSKMSKRQGHTSVQFYRDQGYLPEAILNFIALLGWTHPEEEEIFSLDEFVKVFKLSDLRAVGPAFDLNKLDWFNGVYLRQLNQEQFTSKLQNFYLERYPTEIISKTVPLVQERLKKLSDYNELCNFFIMRPQEFAVPLTEFVQVLNDTAERFKKITEWNLENIGVALEEASQVHEIKRSQFFMALRVAITGKKISPPLNDSMLILGQAECVVRLRSAAALQ